MKAREQTDRDTRTLGAVAVILTVTATLPGVAIAAGTCDPQKLVASDGIDDGRFGVALDVSGGQAVVGARGPDGDGDLENVAYIFTQDSGRAWTETARLTHPDGSGAGVFGAIVAIDGDVMAFGDSVADDACPGDPDCDSGAVNVFTRDAATGDWSFAQRLAPDDGAADDAFGISVAIDGQVIVVGAYKAGTGGAVYVFDRDGDDPWTQRARVVPPTQVPGAWFGLRIAVLDNVIAANAPAGGAVPPDNVRRVHLFERTSSSAHDWLHVEAIESGLQTDAFGLSIALGHDAVIVGDPGDDRGAVNAGAARVYHRATSGSWSEVGTLTEPEPAAQNGFGAVVAADDTLVAVTTIPLLSVGTVRTYRLSGATEPAPLDVFAPPEDAVPSDLFGLAAVLDAGTLMVAASGDDDVASQAGAAYAFDLVACAACPADVNVDGLVGYADLLEILANWGPCPACPQDADGDGIVGFSDVLLVLTDWGPCA